MLSTARALLDQGVHVEEYAPMRRDLFAGVDLVHFFGIDSAHCGLAGLLRGRSVPYVLSPVYYPGAAAESAADRLLARVPGTTRRALSRFVARAAALLPNSRAEASAIRRIWRSPAMSIPVPNGARWSERPDPARFFDRYMRGRIPAGERFVLSVARLDRRKNTLALLRAAADAGVFLVLIGAPSVTDPGYARQVRDEVNAHPERVLLVGELPWDAPELEAAYAAAWAHALVSSFETPGLASLEAAAHGANLVVGDCPPVREYFDGLATRCRGGDVRAVADALRGALSMPRDARGQSAAVRSRYPWSRTAAETRAVYERIIADRAGRPAPS